jgi:putative DNA primase/helicase
MNDNRRPDKTFTKNDIEKYKQKLNIHELYELKSYKASSIQPDIQPWLWDGYIPLETCTLFAGKGGIGKSQTLMWLASVVSTGAVFSLNNTEHQIAKGSVIILSAEDHIKYTIVPRLIAANADLNKIEIIESAVDIKSKINERFIMLDKDISLLEQKIESIGDVKLIIIDPVTAYLGSIKENRSTDVRTFIMRLNKLAEKYKLATILNTHTRKQSNNDSPTSASDEIMGSSAWSNTVRMAFSFTRHHDDKDLFLCVASKTNHKEPPALSYRIKPFNLENNEKTINVSRIEWQEGKIDISADEAINKKVYEERCAIDIAKDFILKILAMGSKSKEDVYRAAENEEINPHTLKLARQRLKQEGVNIIMEPSQTDRRKFIWYIGV